VQFEYEGVSTSVESLKKLLFDDAISYSWEVHSQNRVGEMEAEIIGGNLSLLADGIGTRNELETDGKILFIEEIDEYYYKIDRMLTQLKRADKLNNIAGLIIGQFSELKDTQIKFGVSLEDLVLDKLSTDTPVCFSAPIGHEVPNLAIPCGRKVQLVIGKTQVNLIG
ncbi:MAG: LD-carboxypeptidase, partial [Fulvivirga sp.]